MQGLAKALAGTADVAQVEVLQLPLADQEAAIGIGVAFVIAAHQFVALDLGGDGAGDLVRDHLPGPGEPLGRKREALGPDDLVAAEEDELDEERMSIALVAKPRLQDVADLVALVGRGAVGLERDLRGGVRRDDRDRAQRAEADGDVLDQGLGKARRHARGEGGDRRQQHDTRRILPRLDDGRLFRDEDPGGGLERHQGRGHGRAAGQDRAHLLVVGVCLQQAKGGGRAGLPGSAAIARRLF